MSIANNLRQLRLNSGMTQEQVAEMIGVTRQALSSYESGRTRPDIDMLLRLSEVYGTDIDGVVYGQNRALKSLRIIKTVSFFLYGAIAVLTMISSALLWSANRFYAIPPGQLSAEEKILLESRMRLTSAWETVDGIILTLTLIGFILLFVLFAAWKCHVPMKPKVIYISTLAAFIIAVASLFGLTDSVFAPIDYLLTPIFVVTRILVLFAIHLVIEFLQKRRSKQSEPQVSE